LGLGDPDSVLSADYFIYEKKETEKTEFQKCCKTNFLEKAPDSEIHFAESDPLEYKMKKRGDGECRNRTGDLVHAKHALCQLS
jgi:hypothetical protein